MDRLVTGAPIYWIGGSSCGGKSTLARRLADEHGMALYSCDEHYEEHLLGISDQAPSAMRTVSRMSADEIFYARSVSEQLSTYVDVLMEDFAHVWPDFHRWWGVGWCLCRSGVRGVGVRGTSLVGILTMWPRSSVV